MFKYIGSLIFNENTSIKSQILISYSLMLFISAGITLAICYGLLYGTGETAYTTAQSSIIDDTKSNCLNFATEVSAAINQQLRLIGESVCLEGSLYASFLLPQATDSKTTLAAFSSYRDYNFISGCTTPSCPPDYGPLAYRSRIPVSSGYTDGSTNFSSVYLFSTDLNHGVQNDTDWNKTVATYSEVPQLELALSYEDLDMRTAYQYGSDATLFYYLSTQVVYGDDDYVSVHRTFPGISKTSDSSYDPPTRPWFEHAPIDSLYLYGPYVETFTHEYVINLSSRKVGTATTDRDVNLVSAAVILISALSDIVNNVSYTNDGYGMLVGSEYPYTLFTSTNGSTYSESLGRFLTLQDIDSNLVSRDISQESTFEYTNPSGKPYLVATVPFFEIVDYDNSDVTYNALIMLVFSPRNIAEEPLHSLHTNVDDTTSSVTIKTIIVVVVMTGAILLFVWGIILYVTSPLGKMRSISESIVHIAAEEEDKRDYSGAVEDAFFNQKRRDELGALTVEYFRIVCLLNNKTIEKRNKSKYPVNPFFNPNADFSRLTWTDVIECVQRNLGTKSPELVPTILHKSEPESSPVIELDVLSRIGSIGSKPVNKTPKEDTQNIGIEMTKNNTVHVQAVAPDPNHQQESRDSTVIHVQGKVVEMPDSFKAVSCLDSLRFKLYFINGLLLAMLLIVMIITVYYLSNDGSTWMTETSTDIETQQVQTINSIAVVKSGYVNAYFQQMTTDVLVGTAFVSPLLNHNLTYSTPLTSGHYLTSYAHDTADPYHHTDGSSVFDNEKSSYFFKGWAESECYSINTQSCSSSYNELDETRVLSLSDLKIASYFYSGSYLASIQIGMEDTYQIRTFPYANATDYSFPDQCFLVDLTTSECSQTYSSSRCADPSNEELSYPPYDPTCRSWYAQAREGGNPNLVYFGYPRQSSNTGFVISAVTPINKDHSLSGPLIGVITFNILVQELSDNINSLKILDHGYSYLIDGTNTTRLIVHPHASSSCVFVRCAEDFTDSEYNEFYSNILVPLQTNTLDETHDSLPSTYTKAGSTWYVAYAKVKYGTIRYQLIVTVPKSDVTKSSTEVQTSINTTTTAMIVVFVIIMIIFTIVIVLLSLSLIRAIVNPINELKEVLALVTQDDLSGHVPTQASSKDMKILLDAFGSFMIALRFGSDSYARGNRTRAFETFNEALQLYTATNNLRGIASAHNNLGAVSLDAHKFDEAHQHFQEAIKLGEQMLNMIPNEKEHEDDRKRMQRLISDRKGNLAVVYLEEGNSSAAYALLEELLTSDQKQGYIMGCVVKQGSLGQNYLKQGEFKSAERIFQSALSFTRRRDDTLYDKHWNEREAEVAEQIALFNLASLREQERRSGDALVLYLESLSRGAHMHSATVNKILNALVRLYTSLSQHQIAMSVTSLADTLDFQLHSEVHGKSTVSTGPKRVSFIVDYSGSMSGSKIRTATENLSKIMEEHIYDSDSVSLLHFTNQVFIDFPLITKKGNILRIQKAIKELDHPGGATALYDAIATAEKLFADSPTSNDWIVALTDGEDNSSKWTHENLIACLQKSTVHVIIMGIGSDVQTGILTALAKATSKGTYVFAAGDNASIDQAFGEVIAVIQGQILLED